MKAKLDHSDQNVVSSVLSFATWEHLYLDILGHEMTLQWLYENKTAKEKVILALDKFVRLHRCPDSDSLSDPYPYRKKINQFAFSLLYKLAPDRIEQMSSYVWKNWAPNLLHEPELSLFAMALERIPDELEKLFLQNISEIYYPSVKNFCEVHWTPHIERGLLQWLQEPQSDKSKRIFKLVFYYLLRYQSQQAKDWAISYLTDASRKKQVKDPKVILIAASLLAFHMDFNTWSFVLDHVTSNNYIELGTLEKFLDCFIWRDQFNQNLSKMEVNTLGIFFNWNTRCLKKLEEDSRMHWKVSSKLKNILIELRARKTVDSFEKLRELRKLHENNDDLNHIWRWCEEDYLRKT